MTTEKDGCTAGETLQIKIANLTAAKADQHMDRRELIASAP